MPRYVAALDQGTTSTRCIVFNDRFQIIAKHQLPHQQITPQAGWLEHDPVEIYTNCCRCITEAIKKAKVEDPHFTRVEAVGITNQRETAVAWDKKTGLPLCNAPVWSDARTYEISTRIAAQHGGGDRNFAVKTTGLPCSTYFSAFKYAWLLENVPEVRRARDAGTLLFGTVETWLMWKFSGGAAHLTDFTNASRTFLMDLHSRKWCPDLCAKFGIPLETLPEIRGNSEFFCDIVVSDEGLAEVMPEKLSIRGCIGDQQGSLFGNMCFAKGLAKCTYGTGCFLLMNVGKKVTFSSHGLLATAAYQLEGMEPRYAIESSIAGAGATVEWLRENLHVLPNVRDMDGLARAVPFDCDGVTFVPAFGGLLAPYWDPSARGTIVGMTYNTTRSHLIRATLNAIALQLADSVRAITLDSGIAIREMKVDGGLSNSEVLMEIQAAVLGVPVRVPEMKETTALGAALCAGLSAKVWGSLDEIRAIAKAELAAKTLVPRPEESGAKQLAANWKRALTKASWAKL